MCVPKPQLPALQPTLVPSDSTASNLQLGGAGIQGQAGLGRLALRLGTSNALSSSVSPSAATASSATVNAIAAPPVTPPVAAPAVTPAVTTATSAVGATPAQGGQVAPGYNAAGLVGQRFGIGTGLSTGFGTGAR